MDCKKRKMNYGKQSINKEDILAVEEVLNGTSLTGGSKINEFEEALAAYTGAKYAVVCSNGTAALHLLAMALKPTIVSVPDITFMATANAWAHEGAQVQIVDVQPDQPMMKDTYGFVVPVHMAGFPIDPSRFRGAVIEDACHALGASWIDDGYYRMVGDCAYSKATVFSFHPVKPITTGEGGAITTNDEALATKLRQLRSHGIEDGNYTLNHIGLNYRMTDIQAALGISQLKRLPSFINRRRAIAQQYDAAFTDLDIVGIKELGWQRSGYHLYTLRVANRNTFKLKLASKGINTQIHYKPIHMLEYYEKARINELSFCSSSGYNDNSFPNATKWYDTTISIPCYPDLTDDEVQYIIHNIKEIING